MTEARSLKLQQKMIDFMIKIRYDKKALLCAGLF